MLKPSPTRDGESWTLSAQWIIPIAGPPLERGIVTIAGDRIVSVDPLGTRSVDQDFGNAAILPGLVNAHAHLDLSGLRGKIPPGEDFTAWLRDVIRHRRGMTPEQVQTDVQAGLGEALHYGTTLIGDIAAQGASWETLAAGSLRAVVFYELLGLPRVRAHQAWAAASEWLRTHPATNTCRAALSPHAPYSVRRSLFQAAANLAKMKRIPLAIHLAETRGELELLQHHSGSFVDFLSQVGVYDQQGLVRDAEEIMTLNEAVANVLYAHGNYLEPLPAIPRSSVLVYCPRTHAAFGHKRYPLNEFLAAGSRIALGTDSLASNPDLDLLAEARFVHKHHPAVSAATVLRMATLSGAEALGWETETGSLVSGKSADLVVSPLPSEDSTDPFSLILGSSLPPCKRRFSEAAGGLEAKPPIP